MPAVRAVAASLPPRPSLPTRASTRTARTGTATSGASASTVRHALRPFSSLIAPSPRLLTRVSIFALSSLLFLLLLLLLLLLLFLNCRDQGCDLHPVGMRHGRRRAVPVLSAGDGTQWRLPAQSVNHTPMTAKCMVMATGDPYLADQRKREPHVRGSER